MKALVLVLVVEAVIVFAASAAVAGCRDAYRQHRATADEPDRTRAVAAVIVGACVTLIALVLSIVTIGSLA